MKKEFVRNPYNYDSDELSQDTGLLCKDESRTEQEHLEETDINYIADRFMRSGELPHVLKMPTHGDFSGIFDYQTAMNTIKTAKDEFMALPAKTRTRFGNDPAQLIDFLNDEENRDEAVKLGLLPKPAKMPPPPNLETQIGPDSTERPQGTPQTAPRTGRTQSNEKPDAGTQKP